MFATSPTVTSEVKAATAVGFFSKKASESSVSNLNILVVDDVKINRSLLIRRLPGHNCVEATDGAEAVKAVNEAKTPFDLILMDVEMPNKDGKTATQEIRKLGYLTPIVCFSSTVKNQEDLAALNAELKIETQGMNDFINKCVNPADIQRIIGKFSKPEITTTTTPFWSSTPPTAIPSAAGSISKAVDDLASDLASFGIASMSPTDGSTGTMLNNFNAKTPACVY